MTRAHEADRRYLSDTFHEREPRLDHGLVLSDCLVDWGVAGLGNHSPDISVFTGLKDRPPDPIGTFRLRASGGRCRAAIELVSPHTRSTDVEGKTAEYYRAGVPLFVMIDQKKEGGPRELRVFRHASGAYVEERPERVLIEELGLWVGLKDNRVICYDAVSGAEIGDYTQVQQARAVAEQARQAAEQARQVAEQARHVAETGRQAAEQRALEEARAREAAEQRLLELEAELRRLRGNHPA